MEFIIIIFLTKSYVIQIPCRVALRNKKAMYEKHFPQCLALVNNNQYMVSNIIMISKPQGHAITGTGQMNHFAWASKLVLPGRGGHTKGPCPWSYTTL